MRSLSLTLHRLIPLFCCRQAANDATRVPARPMPPAPSLRAIRMSPAHFAKGFYNIEANAWRWTGKEFAVDLSPPLHSDQRGAQLVMKLAVPDAVIQKFDFGAVVGSIQGLQAGAANLHQSRASTPTRATCPRTSCKAMWCASISPWITRCRLPTPTDANLGIIVSEVGLVAK